MTDLLPSPELCWADATIIANFEAATLPLLYAPADDCKQYFQAMKRKNPRKGLGLEAVFALCLEARAAKDDGSYLSVLRLLREGADRRLQLFHPGDYQVVAAYEHCVWCAIHLGVLELSSTRSSKASAASSLFSFGLDVLRGCKGPGPNGPILSPFITTALEFVLHYNWTSYFVHRSKWHAAAHHAQLTQQRWKRLPLAGGNPAAKPFERLLALRSLLVEERVGEDVQRVRKGFAALQASSAATAASATDEDAAVYGSTTSTAVPGDERDDVIVDDDDAASASASTTTSAPTVMTLSVVSNGEERELTVCLSATRPPNAWEGSIESLGHFLTVYGGCLCDVSLKDYTRCLATDVPPPQGNPLWAVHVDGLRGIATAKRNAAVAMADSIHPMPSSMTRSDGLQIQRIMKKYMLSDRARKQRQKLEQVRRQHLIDEGADEDTPPEELESKWRIAPSQEELSGLLVEEAKQSASVAAFTSMFPLLQRRVAAKDALRVLEDSKAAIVSPAEAARSATETRMQTTRPSTTAAHYKALDADAHVARPASVEPIKGFLAQAASRPPTQPGKGDRRTLPVEVVAAYGGSLPHHRVRSPGKTNAENNHQTRSPSRNSATPTAAAISVSDRGALLSGVTVDWVMRETESSIAGKSNSFKATAAALRAFAESLSAIADDYDGKAKILDDADVLFLAAAATYDAPDANTSTADGPAEEMVSAFDLRASSRSPTNRSPLLQSVNLPSPLQRSTLRSHPPPHRTPSPNQHSMSEDALDTIRKKQRQLRALLPSIDHHSTAYRMVVQELADNERQLQQQREAETVAKLAKDAQLGAERRKSMAHRSPGRSPALEAAPPPALGLSLSPRTGVSMDAVSTCCWLFALAMSPPLVDGTPTTAEGDSDN